MAFKDTIVQNCLVSAKSPSTGSIIFLSGAQNECGERQSEERWLVSVLIFPSLFALFLRSKFLDLSR